METKSQTKTQTKTEQVKDLLKGEFKDQFLKDINEPVEQDAKQEETEKKEVSLFNPLPAEQQHGLPLTTVDMSADLPDLDDESVTVSPLDLSMNYWTPTQPGDSKKVYFSKIETAQYRDVNDADVVVDLVTVFMYTKSKAEGVKGWSNASKKLVSILERNHIQQGTALQITYLGKKKNSTNNFHSDDWSVKPLILKM